jgi:hypothetical protein
MQGGFNSAFSVGPGYEPQPRNSAASYSRVERYYLDLRAKTLRPIEQVVTGHGDVLAPSATTLAQCALGWWERHVDGEPAAEAEFLGAVKLLENAGESFEDSLVWRYDVAVRKYGVTGKWFSAMAQGQAASVLVRAHLLTGVERFAYAAVAAARAMTAHGERLQITRRLAAGVAYEELPSNPPSLILNGWIFALWGLHDVATALDLASCRDAFDLGAATLASYLGLYDHGWWSRYSLFPGDVDLAKPSYHTVHADQLAVMHGLTGLSEFADMAARWRAVDTPRNRARAVAIKGKAVLGSRVAPRVVAG